MIVTAELSLYPLQDNYEATIIAFIKSLKSNPSLQVSTHAMSTFVKGEIDDVMLAIAKASKSIADMNIGFSLVTKIINRDLPVEKGFIEF